MNMTSESERRRACPVCGERQLAQFLEKGSLRLVRCAHCSMVYSEAVPEDIASGLFYQQRPFYLSPEKLKSDYAPVRFERELRLFRRWCQTGAVLDVGCSTGAFLHQLEKRYPGSYDVLGTDVAGPALDYAASRGQPVIRENFLDVDFPAKRFDAITFWAVMEHLVDPQQFLTRAAEILKPGGHCFILVPNLKSLAVRLVGSKYRYIMAEHLNYFTSATLKVFASRSDNLEIIASGSFHFNPVVIWQDLWFPQPSVPDEARGRLLKRTTAWKENRLLKPLTALYGGVERMLGAVGLADNLWIVLRKRELPGA